MLSRKVKATETTLLKTATLQHSAFTLVAARTAVEPLKEKAVEG